MKSYVSLILSFLILLFAVPLWSGSVYKEAQVLYNDGQYQEAVRLIEAAEEPLEHEALYLLGLSYFRLRDYNKAIESFSVLQKETDQHPIAHYYLARSYLNTGQLEIAHEHIQYALTYFPNSDFCYVTLGIIKNRMEEPDKAREALEKAVELNPRNAWARNNLGLFLMRKDYNQEALENFQAAVEYDPDNAVYYNNLGITYERLGYYEEAANSFEKALELRENFPRAQANLKRVREIIQ